MFELKNPEWGEYQPPFYFETEYVRAMAELIQIDDPEQAEAKLEECWIGTFDNDVEMAKHICSDNVEYELKELLEKNPLGIRSHYIKIDYDQLAYDLMLGDVEILYNLDGEHLTYIWSRY